MCGRVHTSLVSEVEIIYVYSVGGLLVVSVHLVVDPLCHSSLEQKTDCRFCSGREFALESDGFPSLNRRVVGLRVSGEGFRSGC